MLFFSKTTNGFYDSAIHGSMPDDAVEIAADLHADLLRQQVNGATIQGDANGFPVVVSPPPPTLAELKAAKLREVNTQAEAIAAQLTAGYPDFERDTWPDQQAEVLAWNADNTAPTPCLDTLAQYRGIDPVLYRQKTLAKVQAYRKAGWYLAGTRQGYEDRIKAAATQSDLDAITITFTLPA
jgi:hypothetical protein